MDACDPRIDIKNLKKLVKQNTGAELNLTRNQICNAYSAIQDGKLPLPPLVLSKDGMYMTDRKSPLTPKEFETLFASTSTVTQLKRVARKAGLSGYDKMTKAQIIDAVVSVLKSKNVHEPIRLHIRPPKASNRRVSVNNNNNNYPSNFNVNNRNGNGVRNVKRNENSGNNENTTLGNISRESESLGNNNTRRNENNNTRRNGNNNNRQPRRSGSYYEAAVRERARENNANARRRENNRFKTLVGALGASRKPSNNNRLTQLLKRSGTTNKRNVSSPENTKRKTIEKLVQFQAKKAKGLNSDPAVKVEFLKESAKHIQGVKDGNIYNSQAMANISRNFDQYEQKALARKGTAEGQIKTIKESYVNSLNNKRIKERASSILNSRGVSGLKNLKQLKELDEKMKELSENNKKQYLNGFKTKSSNNIQSIINKINAREKTVNVATQTTNNGTQPANSNNSKPVNSKPVNSKPVNSKPANSKPANSKPVNSKKVNNTKNNNNNKPPMSFNNIINEKLNSFKNKRNSQQNQKKNGNGNANQIKLLKTEKEEQNKEIANLRRKLNNASLTVKEKNAIQEQLNNSIKNRNNLTNRLRKAESEKMEYMREMNTLAGNVRNITKQKENANAEIQSLRNKLQTNKNLSNGEKRALQEQLNNSIKNRNNLNNRLRKAESEKMEYMREMNALANNVRKANTEIQSLRNKLKTNKNLSNGEKRALQEQLNNSIKNRNNLNNRLRKAESEKMEYMREMNALAGNVRNITKQKENANTEIQSLRNKLKTNKNLSNGEKRALQEQLNNSIKNRNNLTNRLRKAESEKMEYMREMNALAGNVRKAESEKKNALREQETKYLERINNLTRSLSNTVYKKNRELNKVKNLAITQKNENAKTIAKLTKQIENATQKIESANAQFEKQTETIRKASKEIETLRGQLQGVMGNKSKALQNLEQKHQKNMMTHIARVNKLTSNVRARNEEIAKLQEQVRKSGATSLWKGAAAKGLSKELIKTRKTLTNIKSQNIVPPQTISKTITAVNNNIRKLQTGVNKKRVWNQSKFGALRPNTRQGINYGKPSPTFRGTTATGGTSALQNVMKTTGNMRTKLTEKQKKNVSKSKINALKHIGFKDKVMYKRRINSGQNHTMILKNATNRNKKLMLQKGLTQL